MQQEHCAGLRSRHCCQSSRLNTSTQGPPSLPASAPRRAAAPHQALRRPPAAAWPRLPRRAAASWRTLGGVGPGPTRISGAVGRVGSMPGDWGRAHGGGAQPRTETRGAALAFAARARSGPVPVRAGPTVDRTAGSRPAAASHGFLRHFTSQMRQDLSCTLGFFILVALWILWKASA
jgi:hypothetical protein